MDPRRCYLLQLIELGETDLVLEEGDSPARAGAQRNAGLRPDSARLGVPLGPRARRADQTTDAPRREADAPPGATERKAAARAVPAMYPPGATVEAPPARDDLFTADPIAALDSVPALAAMVHDCRKCPLGYTRLNAVPGEGDPRARLACVGEAPGATEDETGRPFVGRAGKLLDDILRAIGLAREEVFICNVLKCRPPNNRAPEPMEVAACAPYLHRQLELIRPKVILALGRPAATTLLNTNASLGDLRCKVHRYRGIPLVVTYHPAALLRNPNWKAPTWDDVRIARRLLDGEAG